jgi:hypothetical protein
MTRFLFSAFGLESIISPTKNFFSHFSIPPQYLTPIARTLSPSPLKPAHVVTLSNRHALLSQEVIRSNKVKVEVRNRKIEKIALSRELMLSISRLQNDFRLLILIESLLVHSLQDLDRLGETGL